MFANELKAMEWVPVRDWSRLTKSCFGEWAIGGAYVGEEDVDSFVAALIKNVVQKFKISYEEVEAIFKGENAAFYEEKEKMFKVYDGYSGTREEMVKLKKMLKVPNVALISTSESEQKVKTFVTAFKKMSKDEQNEVLKRIGVVEEEL